MIFAVL